jgi:hypothetical protein
MFQFHAILGFRKLMHFGVFKFSLKYISYYEMAWKLAFMVHKHVIEFWVENNYYSLNFFDLLNPST